MGAVALLVILYRCCGGSNEWLRTHGLILTAYFALGGVAYDELEGWKLMDSTYFLIVTVTTVGYGDICPITDEGKLFTVVYALLGLIFVFAALSPLLDAPLICGTRVKAWVLEELTQQHHAYTATERLCLALARVINTRANGSSCVVDIHTLELVVSILRSK